LSQPRLLQATFTGEALELGTSHIEQHGRSDEHKRADRLFKQATLPASNSAAVCGPEESDDEEVELLRGAVPQPADWQYTYENIQKFTSWRSSELKARPHVGPMPGTKRNTSRKQLVCMIRVWGMTIRKRTAAL